MRVINQRLQNSCFQVTVQPPSLKTNFNLIINQEKKVLPSICLFSFIQSLCNLYLFPDKKVNFAKASYKL